MDNISDSINHFNARNFNMFQPDFMPEPDFETLISAIRDETTDPVPSFCLDYGCNHLTNSCMEIQLLQPLYNQVDGVIAGGIDVGGYDVLVPNSDMIWNQEMEDVKVTDVFGDDDSSETVTTDKHETGRLKTGSGPKGDRARTLISERKRRSGMKEKLYALRSLVPNITKVIDIYSADFYSTERILNYLNRRWIKRRL